jgi:hypothetical protein
MLAAVDAWRTASSEPLALDGTLRELADKMFEGYESLGHFAQVDQAIDLEDVGTVVARLATWGIFLVRSLGADCRSYLLLIEPPGMGAEESDPPRCPERR